MLSTPPFAPAPSFRQAKLRGSQHLLWRGVSEELRAAGILLVSWALRTLADTCSLPEMHYSVADGELWVPNPFTRKAKTVFVASLARGFHCQAQTFSALGTGRPLDSLPLCSPDFIKGSMRFALVWLWLVHTQRPLLLREKHASSHHKGHLERGVLKPRSD